MHGNGVIAYQLASNTGPPLPVAALSVDYAKHVTQVCQSLLCNHAAEYDLLEGMLEMHVG